MQTSQREANEERKKRGRVKFRRHRRRWKAADEWFASPLAAQPLSSQISLQAWLVELTPAPVQVTSTHLSSSHRPKMSASMASLCLGLKRNSDTSSGECSSGSQSPSSPGGRKTRWNDTSGTTQVRLKPHSSSRLYGHFLNSTWFRGVFQAAT